jgi:hypothetical protein
MVVLLTMLNTNQAMAQEASGSSDDSRKWSVTALAGATRLHPWDNTVGYGEFRLGRRIGASPISIDGGLASSYYFGSLTSGVEVHPWRTKRISPFVRGEAGFLAESDYRGWIVGGGGGTVLRLGSRLGLRFGAALNAHGGVRGPVTTYVGMEYRW